MNEKEYIETTKEISERNLKNIKKKSIKEYWKNHWIVIAALIISLIALINSILARIGV